MTQIVWDDHTGNVHITLRGHAEFAQQGESDIVFAGISMLVCTLNACITQYETRGFLHPVCLKIEPGDVDIAFYVWNHRDTVSVMLDTIITGFRLLQEKYPDNVRLEIKR